MFFINKIGLSFFITGYYSKHLLDNSNACKHASVSISFRPQKKRGEKWFRSNLINGVGEEIKKAKKCFLVNVQKNFLGRWFREKKRSTFYD